MPIDFNSRIRSLVNRLLLSHRFQTIFNELSRRFEPRSVVDNRSVLGYNKTIARSKRGFLHVLNNLHVPSKERNHVESHRASSVDRHCSVFHGGVFHGPRRFVSVKGFRSSMGNRHPWRRRSRPFEVDRRTNSKATGQLASIAAAWQRQIEDGGQAMDVVEAVVRSLEDNPLFNAEKARCSTKTVMPFWMPRSWMVAI